MRRPHRSRRIGRGRPCRQVLGVSWGAQEIFGDLRTSAATSWTESIHVEWIETELGMQSALARWPLIVGDGGLVLKGRPRRVGSLHRR